MDNKIILDCDGVLLDWAYAFDVWMLEQGYRRIPDTNKYYSQSLRYGITDEESNRQIKKFNESFAIPETYRYECISFENVKFFVTSERDEFSNKVKFWLGINKEIRLVNLRSNV